MSVRLSHKASKRKYLMMNMSFSKPKFKKVLSLLYKTPKRRFSTKNLSIEKRREENGLLC